LKDKLIYLFVKHNELKLNFQDVGSGVSYVFPILTSLWASPLSIIEQPELHLHPSAQCEMGDVFIAATKHNAKSIIESHSEHLLLRVLRRIRETTNGYLMSNDYKFHSNELSIYYFEPRPDGATMVKEIRVDDYGELLNTWPGGFFSERERELFGERDLRN
jgi:predicted ATPase